MIDILTDFLGVNWLTSSDLYILCAFLFSVFCSIFIGILSRVIK